MAPAVKKPYDNTRRQAQVRATRLRIIEAAKALFIERGWTADQYEQWLIRSLGLLLRPELRRLSAKRSDNRLRR